MEPKELLHVSINQDTTLLTTGSFNGFQVFRINPLELINCDDRGGFRIVEIFESTQLLLLVGSGEHPAFGPRRLTVWNIAEKSPICETSFAEEILAVRMNRLRIIVTIVDAIYVYNTTTMKTQHVIRTVDNPRGLAELSPSSSCWLLYPSSISKGTIQIYDCFSMQNQIQIEAHNSALGQISISYSGLLFASASIKGTIIRVFSLPEGHKLFTLKRGLISAEIFGLRFSHNSEFLVSWSSTGSIHLFDLRTKGQSESWSQSFKRSLSSAAGYLLSDSYRDTLESSRSLISMKTGFQGRFVAAFDTSSNTILAVSYDSKFVIYKLTEQLEVQLIKSGTLSTTT